MQELRTQLATSWWCFRKRRLLLKMQDGASSSCDKKLWHEPNPPSRPIGFLRAAAASEVKLDFEEFFKFSNGLSLADYAIGSTQGRLPPTGTQWFAPGSPFVPSWRKPVPLN